MTAEAVQVEQLFAGHGAPIPVIVQPLFTLERCPSMQPATIEAECDGQLGLLG